MISKSNLSGLFSLVLWLNAKLLSLFYRANSGGFFQYGFAVQFFASSLMGCLFLCYVLRRFCLYKFDIRDFLVVRSSRKRLSIACLNRGKHGWQLLAPYNCSVVGNYEKYISIFVMCLFSSLFWTLVNNNYQSDLF